MIFLHNPIVDFFYFPILKLLVFLYNLLPFKDLGIVIIILTVLIRLVISPFTNETMKSQKFSEFQKKLQEIREKYKEDKERQAKAIRELLQKEKINPLFSFFSILIQVPIFLALFRVFFEGLSKEVTSNHINSYFLGIIDLSKSFFIESGGKTEYYWPVLILAILAGILQFIQTKTLNPSLRPKSLKSSPLEKKILSFSDLLQKQMLYFFPAITIIILLKLPSALALYWISNSLFSIYHQYYYFKKVKKGK